MVSVYMLGGPPTQIILGSSYIPIIPLLEGGGFLLIYIYMYVCMYVCMYRYSGFFGRGLVRRFATRHSLMFLLYGITI